MVCDFCSHPGPVWSFDCATYEVSETESVLFRELAEQAHVISEGAWLACEGCAALIRRKAWRELAERASEKSPNCQVLVQIIGKTAAIQKIEEMHQGFRRHASGNVRSLKV